jgi:hypothetical protein
LEASLSRKPENVEKAGSGVPGPVYRPFCRWPGGSPGHEQKEAGLT